MFGSPQRGANVYADIGVETGVASASSHQLIIMLFEGTLVAVSLAQQHMKAANIPGKGQAISKAIMIIGGGLRASLNKKNGGDIADNLDALYEYMCDRLMMANLKNQPDLLDEVHRLLNELKDAWEAIGNASLELLTNPPHQIPEYDPLEPHLSYLVKA